MTCNESLLIWPSEWDHLSKGAILLAGLPSIGVLFKLRKKCNLVLAARSESIWDSWRATNVPITSIRRCCERIATEGDWHADCFHPYDSFSLVCHDWGSLSREHIDTDILNAACAAIQAEHQARKEGLLDKMIHSLIKQGDLACMALPPQSLD